MRLWRLDELRELMPRRYLLRRIGLELFFTNGRSHFLCFHDRDVRLAVHRKIISLDPPLLERSSRILHAGKNLLEAHHRQLIDDWQSVRAFEL